ncbi:heavy-metal-associated domain-containing protein [Streptomyces palmae]|uniref:Copper chaperone n=1 Tax=Streptomyces palmae TaxID=1701085 RepID=A0A4Z0GJS8_9ACTN|nr:cation transporter [Streptomyces palmae]TGA95843.1 copper chaperone [Streptomyces palmae]
MSTVREELTVTSSCCTPDHSCATSAATPEKPAEGVVVTYNVAGMTCGHCKATLTKEIGALDGVLSVEVDLGAGQVTVTATAEPDDALIAGTVDEAGYELTGRAA